MLHVVPSVDRYMKYLYPYECEKRRLSTPAELQAAIDGNRREGRRSSYGTYPEMVQRSPLSSMAPTHHSQMSPLSLVTSGRPAMNGNSNHHHHHPSHPSHPQPHSQPLGAVTPADLILRPPWLQSAFRDDGVHSSGPVPGLVASEFEARMVDYVKFLQKEFTATPPGNGTPRQGSSSPPSSTSPQEAALNALGMSRLTLWNLCTNNTSVVPPPAQEPQKEALNLEVREQQARALQDAVSVKRESDGRAGMDNSLVVSMEINGVMYQGVLFAQSARTRLS
ncbi:hypothetical protein C0J52_06511 [Blattella germanica]|nr:hypothetical protein C0J52_06511 [Blattella germanica]